MCSLQEGAVIVAGRERFLEREVVKSGVLYPRWPTCQSNHHVGKHRSEALVQYRSISSLAADGDVSEKAADGGLATITISGPADVWFGYTFFVNDTTQG